MLHEEMYVAYVLYILYLISYHLDFNQRYKLRNGITRTGEGRWQEGCG